MNPNPLPPIPAPAVPPPPAAAVPPPPAAPVPPAPVTPPAPEPAEVKAKKNPAIKAAPAAPPPATEEQAELDMRNDDGFVPGADITADQHTEYLLRQRKLQHEARNKPKA